MYGCNAWKISARLVALRPLIMDYLAALYVYIRKIEIRGLLLLMTLLCICSYHLQLLFCNLKRVLLFHNTYLLGIVGRHILIYTMPIVAPLRHQPQSVEAVIDIVPKLLLKSFIFQLYSDVRLCSLTNLTTISSFSCVHASVVCILNDNIQLVGLF